MALITSGFVHHHQVAKVSLESNLLKWSVKQYYLKALLCELVLCAYVAALDPGGVTILDSIARTHPARIWRVHSPRCSWVRAWRRQLQFGAALLPPPSDLCSVFAGGRVRSHPAPRPAQPAKADTLPFDLLMDSPPARLKHRPKWEAGAAD